jgi:hypothetical protein
MLNLGKNSSILRRFWRLKRYEEGGLAMGRGRQKAKHTKVARELKYFSPSTDYSALEKELTKAPGSTEPDYEDKWADLYSDEGDEEDEGDSTPKS